MAGEARAARRPADAARRFERWLDLIPYGQREPEGVELRRLAERFDDTEEGILADIEALTARQYYLPSGLGDSLQILIDPDRIAIRSPGTFERPVRFSPMEALALQLGLQILLSEAPEDDNATLEEVAERLAATLQAPQHGEVSSGEGAGTRTDGPGVAYGPPLPDVTARVYAELERALRERRLAEIRYFKPHDPDDAPVRRVEPLALSEVRGHWYLLARVDDHTTPKLFRFDRILEAGAVEKAAAAAEAVEIEEYIDPERVYRGDEDDLEVVVVYRSTIARWIQEQYPEAGRDVDGWLKVPHRCKNPGWVLSRALAHGCDARVSEPRAFRTLVVEELESLVS